MTELVRRHYERFPYPPIPALALPARKQPTEVGFEQATALAGTPRPHDGIRILVVGSGTFEPLVIAQAHWRAREVVAVDLSASSLGLLRRRLALSRVAQPLRRRAPVRLRVGDALGPLDRALGEPAFDYILASNVLHHARNPSAALSGLASRLAPGGILRIVTYPRQSRTWMRETSAWLALNGVTPERPGFSARAREAVAGLPEGHPIRSCFDSHPERGHPASLADAFFHPLENPLSPLQWRDAFAKAGLELFAEGQDPSSSSRFLDELLPQARALEPLEKLEILDNVLELCSNPVFWLRRRESSGTPRPSCDVESNQTTRTAQPSLNSDISVPSEPRWELARGLRIVAALLTAHAPGTELGPLLAALRSSVGPRVKSARDSTILPGLSIGEYDVTELLAARPPVDSSLWAILEKTHGPGLALERNGRRAPHLSLAQQASWWQRLEGPFMNEIQLRIVKR